MQKKQKMHSLGFTMIELLVAATIIIVLATIGMVSYQNAGKTSRDAKRKADLQIVRQALVLQKADGEGYPTSDDNNISDSLVVDLQYNGYLTAEPIKDPKNSGPYIYSYSYDAANGKFTLSATLESGAGGTYTLSSP